MGRVCSSNKPKQSGRYYQCTEYAGIATLNVQITVNLFKQ